MSSSYWMSRSAAEVPVVARRTGLVRAQGYAVGDDQGLHNYLGCTLFWAPYGMKYERDRILKNMDYLATKGVDYVRILCECDWDGRSWGPELPDYQEVINSTINALYDRGIRTQPTLVGGRAANHMEIVRQLIPVFKVNREKLVYIECVNEWTRLDKANREQLVEMTRALRKELPHIIGMSCIQGPWDEWFLECKKAGADLFIIHTERSEADGNWRQVRQAYDFSKGPWTGSNQEGPGPQSSVGQMEEPLHIGMFRFLSHIMKCGFFTFHVGAGVTGVPDSKYGRPANIWESPNIDAQFAALHMVEQFIPEGVQNWKVINNGRSDHPLPLDGHVSKRSDENENAGFWEGTEAKYGSVNKNYAVAHQDGRFIVALTGVNKWDGNSTTLVGKAHSRCTVAAWNPLTGEPIGGQPMDSFQDFRLPGREDKQIAYIVIGKRI